MDLQPNLHYSAGVMTLDTNDSAKVLYRSTAPMMEPESTEERQGIMPNVVFSTAVVVRHECETDVYYGMAGSRIGAARIRLPDQVTRRKRLNVPTLNVPAFNPANLPTFQC
jgi:predicted GH43/DUF377 family glycosyl hydrolase